MAVPYDFILGLKERAPRAVLCAIPDHPDGPVYIWSGIGTLEYDGKEWLGAGILGSVQSARRTAELRVDEVTLTMSGIDPAVLGEVSDDIRDVEAETYLAVLTPEFQVRSVMLIDTIRLDHMRDTVAEDGTATLSVIGEAGLWQLQLTTDEVWSDANQKLKYPTDTGLELIASMRNKQTNWIET